MAPSVPHRGGPTERRFLARPREVLTPLSNGTFGATRPPARRLEEGILPLNSPKLEGKGPYGLPGDNVMLRPNCGPGQGKFFAEWKRRHRTPCNGVRTARDGGIDARFPSGYGRR